MEGGPVASLAPGPGAVLNECLDELEDAVKALPTHVANGEGELCGLLMAYPIVMCSQQRCGSHTQPKLCPFNDVFI